VLGLEELAKPAALAARGGCWFELGMSGLLGAPVAQAESLRLTSHRPWPLPEGRWLIGQTWESLLFAHWPVDKSLLRPHVPSALELDEHGGSAWVGLTPFRVSGLRFRGTLPVPGLSGFLELNCRTYVTVHDRPGIWFFSLDASSRWAVEAARRLYRLPYEHARIRAAGGSFEASRIGADGVCFSACYEPRGPIRTAERGSLEHFLTERYCLYADDGRARAEIHHAPWPLQEADGEVALQTVSPVPLDGEPLLHFAGRLDVLIWPLERAL
jgi:uncharacterized protein YqjF (DUF2071 family)